MSTVATIVVVIVVVWPVVVVDGCTVQLLQQLSLVLVLELLFVLLLTAEADQGRAGRVFVHEAAVI